MPKKTPPLSTELFSRLLADAVKADPKRAGDLIAEALPPDRAKQLVATLAETLNLELPREEGRLDEDTYSLWGRCHKDSGDRHMSQGQAGLAGSPLQRSAFQEADEKYRLAIEKYRKAFEVAEGFFPGINVATLTFLRAGLCTSLGRIADAQFRGDVVADPRPAVRQ